MRALLIVAVLLSVDIMVEAPTARACVRLHIDVFTLADRSDVFGVGRTVRGGVRITDPIRGNRGARARVPPNGSSCELHLRPGVRGLAFVKDRRLVSGEAGFLESPRSSVVAALRRYAEASPYERRALLVELAGDADVGFDALHALATRPEMIRVLTSAERQRLVALVPRVDQRRLQPLAVVLARAEEVDAIDPLIARIPEMRVLSELIVPLEVLTNHRHPGPERAHASERIRSWAFRNRRPIRAEIIDGRRVVRPGPTPGELALAHWRQWRSGAPSGTYAAGFRERNVAPPSRSDPAQLARVVRQADDLSRVVAFERCQVHWGRVLTPHAFARFGVASHLWSQWADACETGVPATY